MPANGETVTITVQLDIPVKVSDRLLKRTLEEYNSKSCVTKNDCYACTASNVKERSDCVRETNNLTTYKFLRDVIFADYPNLEFLRFYFRGSLVITPCT